MSSATILVAMSHRTTPTLAYCLLVNAIVSVSAQTPPDPPLYPLTADEAVSLIPIEERKRIERLRESIIATAGEPSEATMADYTGTITKSGKSYAMVRIPGGEFLLGTPPEEVGRHPDEGPRVKVKLSPFWIARFETTWEQFEAFARPRAALPRHGNPTASQAQTDPLSPDHVSSPSSNLPYQDMYGASDPQRPVVNITHHAANKFCEWLSFQTRHFYRLPTEAEWEYACRAGTHTAYSYPETDGDLYAVLDPEQTRQGPERVGSRQPNAWGLHDMHGNVMEWCLDQYEPGAYQSWTGNSVTDPWIRPRTRYPRVLRGGSWYDLPIDARSGRRFFSSQEWQRQDPNFPKSLWYLINAEWVGFRILRPLQVPSVEEMIFSWNNSLVAENAAEARHP